MGFNQKLSKAFLSSSGTFNGNGAGTAKFGTTVPIGGSPSAAAGLVANFTCGIFTNTITYIPSFQVSQDGVTFTTIFPTNGSAYVTPLAAGTGGLVTTVFQMAFPCPGQIPYPFVRAVLTNGVATGVASDVYTISYNFTKQDYT